MSHGCMSAMEPMTRAGALKSLADFLPKVATYQGERSYVRDGHPNVSGLSAALRFRLILEDEVVAQTLARYTLGNAEKWLQEVCWRRYWKGWLEQRPGVWTGWRERVGALRETLSPERAARAEAVAAGQSGVACMDAIARELVETGYLHNHARMWWASFWIHAERLPWELGADFFFRHLLDADSASNTLSWRWVAGLQTPGKTYLVRLSNVEKYGAGYLAGREEGRLRLADGAMAAAPVKESAEVGRTVVAEYPAELADGGGRVGLWLHSDDLLGEVGPLAALSVVAVAAGLSDGVDQKIYRLSERRRAVQRAAVGDGLERAAAHFGCGAAALAGDDLVAEMGDWAAREKLAEVVGFAPMVGPLGDLRPRLEEVLRRQGVRLRLVRRASDAVAFSFAGAGFFPFWQKMSRHLSQPHPL